MNLNYLKMPPCHFDLLTCSLQIEAQPKDKINGELMCAKRMQWYLRVCLCVCGVWAVETWLTCTAGEGSQYSSRKNVLELESQGGNILVGSP